MYKYLFTSDDMHSFFHFGKSTFSYRLSNKIIPYSFLTEIILASHQIKKLDVPFNFSK